jgi:hypothetical protein
MKEANSWRFYLLIYPGRRLKSAQLVDVLEFDAHPDMYGCFEGKLFSTP